MFFQHFGLKLNCQYWQFSYQKWQKTLITTNFDNQIVSYQKCLFVCSFPALLMNNYLRYTSWDTSLSVNHSSLKIAKLKAYENENYNFVLNFLLVDKGGNNKKRDVYNSFFKAFYSDQVFWDSAFSVAWKQQFA